MLKQFLLTVTYFWLTLMRLVIRRRRYVSSQPIVISECRLKQLYSRVLNINSAYEQLASFNQYILTCCSVGIWTKHGLNYLPIKWRIKKFNVRGQSKLSFPSYAATDRVTLRIILKDRLVSFVAFSLRHAPCKQ